jgi:hypothetical protein
MERSVDVTSFVGHLRLAAQRDRQMVHVEELQYRDAAHGELRDELHPLLREVFGDRGVLPFSTSQAQAISVALVLFLVRWRWT